MFYEKLQDLSEIYSPIRKSKRIYEMVKTKIDSINDLNKILNIDNYIDIILKNIRIEELNKLLLIDKIKKNSKIFNKINNNIYKVDYSKQTMVKYLDFIEKEFSFYNVYNNNLYILLEKSNENIVLFLKYMNPIYIDEFINFAVNNYTDYNKLNEIVNYCIFNDKEKFITDVVLNNKNVNLYDLYQENNCKLHNIIRKKILNDKKKFANDFLKSYLCNYSNYTFSKYDNNIEKKYINLDKEEINDFIYFVLNEITNNENTSIDRIKYLAEGGYSSVYELGNKIIKLSTKKGTYDFPNNPYILKFILRKKICRKYSNDILFYIEITQKIDTKCKDEYKLYNLYKKMRDIGLIWTDVKFKNIGVLSKDNIIDWKENIEPTDDSLGLKKYKNGIELHKGDYVILDMDYIYDEKNDNIQDFYFSLKEKFEKQYQLSKIRDKE